MRRGVWCRKRYVESHADGATEGDPEDEHLLVLTGLVVGRPAVQNLIGDRSERPAVRRRARVACRAVSEEGRGEIGREVTWSANGVGELRFSQALKALTAAEICELEAADHCGVGAGAEDVLWFDISVSCGVDDVEVGDCGGELNDNQTCRLHGQGV